MKTLIKLLLVGIITFSLAGCGGMAGNYNPDVDASSVSKFWSVNNEEIGYLYNLFAKNNTFTDNQLGVLNQSRYTISAIIERVNKLNIGGGVTYQDFKVNFQLGTDQYYLMKPILSEGILLYENPEPKIIYYNMVNRADYFISQCNRIINHAEDEIDEKGMSNLLQYGEGFYNALAPILDVVL